MPSPFDRSFPVQGGRLSSSPRPISTALLILLLAIAGSVALHAQTPLSGVVNLYTPVTAVGGCSVDVLSTDGLAVGDRVLIIQMTGATVETPNSERFGSILSSGSAGHYELATIASISGNRLILTRRLARQYDLRGRIQVVRVARHDAITVTGEITAPAWNGATGGVIAIEAAGKLSLGADIVASGRGFSGGALVNMVASCTRTDYFYNSSSSYGANKGSGIALLDPAFARGRGAAANGGGGGNDHNGGGGGGANRGEGGMGGFEFTECSQGEPATRGIGGHALLYDAALNTIFMGGGGGAGHGNNNRGSAGAAGGGIVLVRAGEIEGDGFRIASDGATAGNTINGGYDGAGGGGAGGTILLDVPKIAGALAISARGGNGGSTSSTFVTEQHGPGGGGGGGLLWISATSRPAGVSLDLQGGNGGVFITNNNDPWGATAGTDGEELTGLRIPEGGTSNHVSLITPSGPTRFCRGGSVILDAGAGHSSVLWSPGGYPAQSITVTEPGFYTVAVVDADGCSSFDTISVEVDPLPVADAGPDLTICRAESVRLGPAGTTGNEPYRYQWSPAAGLDDPFTRNPVATLSAGGRYTLLVTDTMTGCTTSDEMNVSVRQLALRGAPGPIDFGLLDGCRSSRDTTILLLNDGREPLQITRKTLEGDPGFELVAPTLPLTIPPGASAAITIRFSPGASGRMTSTLHLAALPCDLEYAVELRGERGDVSLAADPIALSFGRALLCQSPGRDTTLTLRNLGSIPVVIERPLAGAPFSIPAPAFPVTLAAGAALPVTVRYAPTAAGRFTDDLRFPFVAGSCSDTLRIGLDAEVEDASLTADLLSIAFPPLLACESGSDTTIIIKNHNSLAATLDAVAPGSGFSIRRSLPIVVEPFGQIELPIRFEPSAHGASSARLELRAEPCGRPLSIELSGVREGSSVIVPDTIDFGEIVACRELRREARLAITGVGPSAGSARVAAVSVVGPFSTEVKVGDILPNGAPVDFAITFAPGADGEVSGRIDLLFEPCNLSRSVVLRGRRVSAVLEASAPVDLGELPVGASDTAEVRFTNSGSATITIDSLRRLDPAFELIETAPALPALLSPGERVLARVRYTAVDHASRTAVTAVASEPCALDAETIITGRGVAPFSAASVVALPVLEAEPGEHVRIPLTLLSSRNLEAGETRRFSVAISFNRTLLVPADGAIAGVERGNERVITIDGIRADGSVDGELVALEMIATLGNAEATPLTIETFEWVDDRRIAIERIDGLFSLGGICRDGGVRLFSTDGRLALKPPTPNPVASSAIIDYEVTEPGRTRLMIRNLRGEVVATPVDGLLPAGHYQLTLDASGIPAGRYLCVLETPTRSLTQVMVVVR